MCYKNQVYSFSKTVQTKKPLLAVFLFALISYPFYPYSFSLLVSRVLSLDALRSFLTVSFSSCLQYHVHLVPYVEKLITNAISIQGIRQFIKSGATI